MDYEDIVIGSGLAALGAVLGLTHSPSVLVLAGPASGTFSYYDERGAAPCAFHGLGGLGTHWHGVIPMSARPLFGQTSDDDFRATFARFYPRTPAEPGHTRLFVPWRPIRPSIEIARLARERGARLTFLEASAEGFDTGGNGIEVRHDGGRVRARRLWVAAGAVHTPALLERALGRKVARGLVSDHVLCYIGLAQGLDAPQVQRHADGLLFPAHYDPARTALYTTRPARFNFRRLDNAIEQRAVFGLPTGSAVAKIARRASPGLLAEAFYNRFGLFPRAATYSIYAQVPVADAYELGGGTQPLTARNAAIQTASDTARARQPFGAINPSKRRDICIPGIHLHHSLDLHALAAAGINQPGAAVQVVDASALPEIGPDHHSFKMLVDAARRAQQACNDGHGN